MKLLGFFKKGRECLSAGEEESIMEVFRHFTLLLQANNEALERLRSMPITTGFMMEAGIIC
jgi:hypothetical protein